MNIGAALTPLGDPPLFLGFLKGVAFFWTTKAMLWPMPTAAFVLRALFYAIDALLYNFEWGPIVEVAKLFAGIFLTIIPAIAILRAGYQLMPVPASQAC